jgi:hypothetical protein
MKRYFVAGVFFALPALVSQASASVLTVPEAGATGSVAALAAVAVVGAIAWERRRRGPKD